MLHKLHKLRNHQPLLHFITCLLLTLVLFLVGIQQEPSYALSETAAQTENPEPDTDTGADDDVPATPESEPTLRKIAVGGLNFKRVSRTQIKLTWPQVTEVPVERYYLQRRKPVASGTAKKWKTIETIEAADTSANTKISVIDRLSSAKPQQYQYRVIAETYFAEDYTPPTTKNIFASNVMVCIDPGHYTGKNAVPGEESYDYAEGDFTLLIAKSLKKELKKNYGIDSFLTRTGDSITLGGYTDLKLDSAHISLRGEYAAKKDSDLFLSLHTNANATMANGYDTYLQPASIGKCMMIMNVPAMKSERALTIANTIGSELSSVNYSLGISANPNFRTAKKGKIKQWTGTYNDGLNETGAVVYRLSSSKNDYYGVLRGSANVGVPGIIIEHSFHTIAEMRRLAMEEDLNLIWAKIDARGVAAGYGFIPKKPLP